MYNFNVSDHLQKILNKLSGKDTELYNQILKKIDEIVHSENIDHYKNLRYNMKDSKRAHIGPFVLIFQYKKEKNLILFDDFTIMTTFTNKDALSFL